MKRALKILVWLLGLLILLLLSGMVAIQSPKVQTWLGTKAVERMKDKVDADISFSLVSLRPFEALVLEDVLVKDRAPAVEGMDTVLFVRNLSVKFSLKGLFLGKGADIKRLKLNGGAFNLVFEEGLTDYEMNLYRVFRIQDSATEEEDAAWGQILSARYVEVKDFDFRMYYPPREGHGPVGPGVIDWDNFRVHVYEIDANHVNIADGLITGAVDKVHARESDHGFTLHPASARRVQVGLKNVTVEGLHVVSGNSDIRMESFIMDGDIGDYGDFLDKIYLKARIAPGSVLDMQTIRYFSDGVEGITFKGALDGWAEGYVSDFQLKDLRVEDVENDVRVLVSGGMKGLPDTQETQMDFQVKELDFDLDGLGGFVESWAPGTELDLNEIARGERLHFTGRVDGLLNRLHVNGNITSGIGRIHANATLHNCVSPHPILIGGRVETENLDLGRVTGSSSLGPLSMRSGLEARFGRDGMSVRIDSLAISRLNALDYDYTNISAAGTYAEDAFDGRIIAADPNLNFLFQGKFNLSQKTKNAVYSFYASLGYADLHALHLDKRERSKLSFQAVSNFVRTEKRDLLGNITLNDIFLESGTGHHDIGQLSIRAHANDNVNRIRLESNFLEGSFVGDAGLGTFLNDLRYLVLQRDLPALLESPPAPWEGSSYNLALTVKDAQELFNFLVPGLYIEKNTTLDLEVNPEGLVAATLKSGRLAYDDKFVKDFLLSFDNGNQAQTATVTGRQISLSGTRILNNSLTLFADDNQVGIGYTFDNGEEEETRAQLYLSGDLSRDADGLKVAARALPSNIYYRGKGWGLSSDEIVYHGGNLNIERLLARHDDEALFIQGGYSSDKADTLSIQMEKFDIGLLNTLSGDIPELAGHATGYALLFSPSIPSSGLLASITCDSTRVAGHRMGTLTLSSVWDEKNERFNASVRNLLDGRNNLDADAYLQPSSGAVHASARLDKFNMGYAAPLLNSLFTQFGGMLSGEVGLDGKLDKLHLSSRNLRIEDGALELDYTRVPYAMAGEVELDDTGLHFKNVALSDGMQGKGTITGSILMRGFQDFALDTHIRFTNMEVLNLPYGVNSLLYGTAGASGRADITGPINKLLLDVNASTSRNGDLHVSLGGSSSDSSRKLLTFKEAPALQEVDPYELMMASRSLSRQENSDFAVKLRIQATPDLQLSIDLNQESSLSARGRGNVELGVNSTQGFTMNGDYNISEGTFLFSTMNLISRKFTIQDGSVIRFNGDIWDTDLDVMGLYITKASLANLIGNESAGNRRTVNCGIHISDRLRNPQIDFSIDIPDLNPATQAQVEGALNSVDKVQKQFIYLLLASNFLPAEESGITQGGSDVLFSNVSSIMSGQLNNIFQKLDIPLDLGLNYQSTQTGSSIFDVALSTQLFNNRVIVNGTVGNKMMLGGTSTNEVAGDLDVEIKLNRNGSLRLKLFTHSADQYSAFLDNSQRHGGGISYQRDFNNFLQFIKSLFTRRDERERQYQMEVLDATHNVVLEVDEQGKTTLQ